MQENLLSQTTIEIQKQMDSRYLDVLEKTNEQLNHNINISGNIIATLTLFLAILGIGVTIYFFVMSSEQKKEREKIKAGYKKQLQEIEKVAKKEVEKLTTLFEEMKGKFEQMKNQTEELDKQILETKKQKDETEIKEGETSQKVKELEGKIKELESTKEKIQENYNESPLIWATSGLEIGNKFNDKKDFHVCEKCGIVFSEPEKRFDFNNPTSVTDFHTINFTPLRANTIFLNHNYELPFERKKIKCPNCKHQQNF